jgi:uncharacterized protein (DUF427 family)
MADTSLDRQLEDEAVVPAPSVRPFSAPVWTQPWPRRVRGYLGHEAVVDSRRALLLFEDGHLPVWYFPADDVRTDLLEPSTKHTQCPRKGTASYWTARVGDREVRDAAWSYEQPIAGREDIAGYLAFYWGRLDHWYEEDDEVFVHARDPYHRVDVLNSSRHVRIELDGVVLAESRRPRLLFETRLPTRYYLPKADVRMELLEPSDTSTQCPYKGVASYYSARVGDRLVADLAWTYPYPIPECPKVEGLVAFYDEHVDVWVDGEPQPRPDSPWSRR